MKKIAILGSTGSIGVQTLEVIDEFEQDFMVEILSAHGNTAEISRQILKYQPSYVFITDQRCYDRLSKEKWTHTKILYSFDLLNRVLSEVDIDLCVGAIAGAAGIIPTLDFLEKGIDVALANKETIVSAGSVVREVMERSGARVITIDSEHSAIMQCLEESKATRKILLTASGGPFRTWSKEQIQTATLEDALQHPTWSMGQKITIDSATLMNKGLEVIEAHWLFKVDYDSINVIIHPESIVHSMVEYGDGSIIGHLGPKDMKIPIQYALTYPERTDNSFPKIDLTDIAALTFYKPDYEKFPCLALAYEAGKMGGTMTAVLNAANEAAVELLLNRKITFAEIPGIVEKVMSAHRPIEIPDFKQIMTSDKWARKQVIKIIQR